jgi:putative intracellular protease/amidase
VQRGKLPQRTRHDFPLFSPLLAVINWLQVLTARGATFVDGGNWACNVQHDGQVFTGQNPMSASAIGKAIAAALASA